VNPTPLFFPTAAGFRRWLAANHATASELWVGFYKKGTGRPSITWRVRRRVDEESYTNRFTPRRKGSVWSVINTRRARELLQAGRMRAPGRRAFEARDEKKTARDSFEQRQPVTLAPELEARFRAHPAAWDFFMAQPAGYRRVCLRMVVSAAREATRLRRLDILIAHSAAGRRLDPMKPQRMP
jgi:uncharacterized protein YdeI (YjbR/CyaY-like superfamily)